MKFVIQRVKEASVEISGGMRSRIGKGLMVLVGCGKGDTKEDADKLIKKMLALRIFSDSDDKMNLNVRDVNGELLLVSQFTLYADCRKGTRPSFDRSMPYSEAETMYNYIVSECEKSGINTETGVFGADMQCGLINDGPVTIILDSEELNKSRRG